MIGIILDIYPEGKETFRACILEEQEEKGTVHAVNLKTGVTTCHKLSECGDTLIDDIFDLTYVWK